MGSLPSDETIPTIDIGPFLASNASEQAVAEVVESVRHACTTYGFFQLVGHGISDEVRDGILECAKRFFNLPLDKRMEVQVKHSMGKSFLGYEPVGQQTHQKGLKTDTKEAYSVNAGVPEDDPEAGTFFTGPNLWPKSLPDDVFRTPVLHYQTVLTTLGKTLLEILARGLPREWGCSPNVFDEYMKDPSNRMRLLHYAPQPIRDESQFGVAEHTDFGGITILLLQEGTAGLEVWYPPAEKWIHLPVQRGAFVVNMGDLMQRWSAGYYRSARHRVISPVGDQHRYSVPFFVNGNLKLKCTALDGSGLETVVGEHIRQRLIETMGENAAMVK